MNNSTKILQNLKKGQFFIHFFFTITSGHVIVVVGFYYYNDRDCYHVIFFEEVCDRAFAICHVIVIVSFFAICL